MSDIKYDFRKLIHKRIFGKLNISLMTIYKAILLSCVLIHLSYLVIFAVIGVKFLAVFNFFSVILYIILFVLLLQNKYVSAVMLSYIEICIHSVIATVLLGWDCGFCLHIITLIPIAFYWPFKKNYTPYIFSGFSALFFVLLKIYSYSNLPVYREISTLGIGELLYLYNSFMSIIILIILTSIHSIFTRNSQTILSEKNKNLLHLASTDPLTGLLNRRSMVNKLEDAYTTMLKFGKGFSVALCDIDDFKKVNDCYGHDCGDYVLKALAKLFRTTLKDDFSVCRWGGEEILILYPNVPCSYAGEICENLRAIIEAYMFTYSNTTFKITMTFGVSGCDEDSSISDMLIEADRNLYRGKNNGKNCVISD